MAIETLRPNAPGDKCEFGEIEESAKCPDHYQNVDEEIHDNETTLVQDYEEGVTDLYNIENSKLSDETINKIRVYAWLRYYMGGWNNSYFGIKTGGTEYWGDIVSTVKLWEEYHRDYFLNPKTSAAWTIADINALQVGVKVADIDPGVRLTQIYVEVNYTPLDPPEVSTQAASDIIVEGGTLNGTITDIGVGDADERGFVYDTESHDDPGNTDPDVSEYANNWTETNSFEAEAFDHALTDLEEGVLVYFRACAHNADGWAYGAEKSFTPLSTPVNPLISRDVVSRFIIGRKRIR